MLYNRIVEYLEKNKLLSDQQFGFRKNSSPTLATTFINDNLIKNFDRNMYSCLYF